MFGFDDEFGLDDLIEADIKFGLFEDDEKVKVLKRKKENLFIRINKYIHLSEKIEECYINILQILKNSHYSEKDLFRAHCKIADIQEKIFYLLKEKLEKDYEFIIEYAEHCANDDEDLKDYIETFCEEYNEMEDCLDVFDDVLEYEYEDGFEEKVEKYADKKSELEDELSDIEDLKDELEMLIY